MNSKLSQSIVLLSALSMAGWSYCEVSVTSDGTPSDYTTVPDLKTLQTRLQVDQTLAAQGKLSETAMLADSAYTHNSVLTGTQQTSVSPGRRPPLRPVPVATVQGIPVYNGPDAQYAFTSQEIFIMNSMLSSIPAVYLQGIKKIVASPLQGPTVVDAYQFSSNGTLTIDLQSLANRINASGGEYTITFTEIENALGYAVGASVYRSPTILSTDEHQQIASDTALENSLIAPGKVTAEDVFASTFSGWLGAGTSGGSSASILSGGFLDATRGNLKDIPCSEPLGCAAPTPGYSPVLSEALLVASLFTSPTNHSLAFYTLGGNPLLTKNNLPYTASPTSITFDTPFGPMALTLSGNQVVAVSDTPLQAGVMHTLAYPVTLSASVLKAFGIGD